MNFSVNVIKNKTTKLCETQASFISAPLKGEDGGTIKVVTDVNCEHTSSLCGTFIVNDRHYYH